MAVRLFLTNWSVVNSSVVTPISLFIESQEELGLPLPQFDFTQNFFPTATAAGLPDKTMVVVMIKGSAGIEDFGDIVNVDMIPPETLSQTMNQSRRNRLKIVTTRFAIPPNIVDDAVNQRGVVDGILRHLEPASSGLDEQFALDNDAEFG